MCFESDGAPFWTRSDRFRTMINVLGDALAAGIIAHLCRKDFPLSETGKVKSIY